MSLAITFASTLSGTISSPPPLRCIVLILQQRSNGSPAKSCTEVRPESGSTLPKVFQLYPPHFRRKPPVPHKDHAFWKHPPYDCHRPPGSRNCHQSPGFRKNSWTQSSPSSFTTPPPSWHAPSPAIRGILPPSVIFTTPSPLTYRLRSSGGRRRSSNHTTLGCFHSSSDSGFVCISAEILLVIDFTDTICTTFPHSQTSRSSESTICKYPASCRTSNNGLGTWHQPFDSSLS